MVGMRDVAKEAGVSLSTVSLVVNKTGYVSDDMRARVKAAMKELNYVPNELARNLYKNRTNLVGVIVPTIRHPFFATLTAHLQRELAAQGLRTMLCSTADAENGEVEYVDMLRRHMMDGIIVCSHTTHPNDYWTSIHRPMSPSTVCWAAASRRSAPTMSRAAGSWRTCWSTPARTTW